MVESGIPDFLRQLPGGIIALFCLSALVLGAVLSFIVSMRLRRARVQPAPALPSLPLMAYQPNDMPDLDALLRSDPTAAPARARSGAQPVLLGDGGSADAVELLTVMRDITTGGLIVQINDKAYRVAKDMSDAEFRQKMLVILRELAQTAGTGGSQPIRDAVKPAATTPAPAAPAAAPPPVQSQPPAARPAAPPPTSAAFDLPKYSLDDQPIPTTRRDLKRAYEQPIPELDIAGRIEAFLQHKLSTSGQFAGRGLHVKPAPDGGIRIELDNRSFQAVDEVNDPDVRLFLQQTIQEWQDRQ